MKNKENEYDGMHMYREDEVLPIEPLADRRSNSRSTAAKGIRGTFGYGMAFTRSFRNSSVELES
ncbi:MAG: hypothetical protein IPG69_06275 [Flavobacteriales bacterium]|nr:hypothetical protein [Flavobacteriales bacterium]